MIKVNLKHSHSIGKKVYFTLSIDDPDYKLQDDHILKVNLSIPEIEQLFISLISFRCNYEHMG